MIPQLHINFWRNHAPWPDNAQIEQDLILSRAIVDIFSDPYLAEKLVFRGGTALHKLFLKPSMRYSEDIDLVQSTQESIGEVMSHLRKRIDPWFGKPQYKQTAGRVTFTYKFESEIIPIKPMKVKIEINTREHFSVLGLEKMPFQVSSPWFTGKCEVNVHAVEELLGTKLRALYQRRKGRDLFDLVCINEALSGIDWDKVLMCFHKYMEMEGNSVSRAEFEKNIFYKVQDIIFKQDLNTLISEPMPFIYDLDKGVAFLEKYIYPRLHGDPWKK
jgi:predicted nucleotidyltransferase component of viral defense system